MSRPSQLIHNHTIMEGWIKFYRKLLDNDILKYDHTAFVIFVYVLLACNKGRYTCGRFQMADELGLKPCTFYKALNRLAKKWKMVTLNSNNRFTEIIVINWHKYQGDKHIGNTSSNNAVTTQSQRGNTVLRIKNKNKNNTNTSKFFDFKHRLSTVRDSKRASCIDDGPKPIKELINK